MAAILVATEHLKELDYVACQGPVPNNTSNNTFRQTLVCHSLDSSYPITMIKLCVAGVALLLTTILLSARSTVEMGQSLEHTLEVLGEPIGKIDLRDKTLLLYPQGEVTLRDNLVAAVDLMSDEQFAADQERLRLEREEWDQQQKRLTQARNREGEAIKKAKMTSSAFATLSAKDRGDYWRRFQIRYPQVEVSEQIASALEGYQVELAELKSEQRIAELEARVTLAQKEAATARLETEKLRDQTKSRNRSSYGLRTYTTPIKNYYYRPPTITIYSKERTNHQANEDTNCWKHPYYDQSTRTHKSRTERTLHTLEIHKKRP